MRYKSQGGNISDINFLRELFDIDEFVSKSPRDSQPFYYVFFHTKLFLYFLCDILPIRSNNFQIVVLLKILLILIIKFY